MEMSLAQVMAEVGRLHMENLALRTENEQIRSILAAQAQGGAALAQPGGSEAATADPGAPGGDPAGEPAPAE